METKKRKVGRPRLAHARVQVPIRMTPEEKDMYTRAAQSLGQELAPWVRLRLTAAARKDLEAAKGDLMVLRGPAR